ncbi:MAG: alpha-galactosidase [Terriglobia bacterium]
MKAFVAAMAMWLCCVAAQPRQVFSATVKEADEAGRWVSAKFLGKSQSVPEGACLLVYTRNGLIEKNTIAGQPLRIAAQRYQRGLHFGAGKIEVRLPRPAQNLYAVLGPDSNHDDLGYGGRGSFVLSVEARGAELFRSSVLREGMAGVPINVNLAGAREFTLELKPVGDRKPWDDAAWDQADWAEARVTLADGSTVWLADLPVGPARQPYTAGAPFSFRYRDRPSSELLKTWEMQRSERHLDENRTEYTLTYADPETGLRVRCVAVAYRDFPTVEWTVYFKNEGKEDTPILEQIQALDTRIERSAEGEFTLHHSKGSLGSPTDYEPLETALGPKAEERITAMGGRPTNSDLCYFNVERPGEGVIIALGWPGQWAAEFKRDEGRELQVRAGQELTHFKLLPGEEVRTPLVAMQFWSGDWTRAQNVWRRWMIAHNLPRPGGKLPAPQLEAEPGIVTNIMQDADESNQKTLLGRYLEERIPLDYWWMDAGWYPFRNGWWNVGTWEPDSKRFPQGLRAVTDYAHSKGLKSIVWFEPERVAPGSWLYEKHPEWLLGREGENKLLYLGNEEAWRWLVERVGGLLKEQGIDLYRQDFNFDPLSIWRANDKEDRQGITEIRHVTGYLAYWDELRRRFPNMLIDSCASGGRRNDLETMRRAVPLWRSDFVFEPIAMQNITYGIAFWIPYFGTGINRVDPYSFRSDMCPAAVLQLDVRRKDLDYDGLRRLCSQWRKIAEYYYGDYYPLVDYSTKTDTWVAWQFDRPEQSDGLVQVFRRPDSPFEVARFKLHGLDPSAQYEVANLDIPGTKQMTGQELMDKGLLVEIGDRPGSAVLRYERRKK